MNNDANGYRCPFRRAVTDVSTNNSTHVSKITYWIPRDTFSSWSDGTSNQLCVGEKHFALEGPNQVGRYTAHHRHADASYLTAKADGNYVCQMLRTFDDSGSYSWAFIAQWGYIDSYGDNGSSVFGANHTGVCNFLIGDGSVRGLSNTTSGDVLRRLSNPQDGVAVAMP